MLERKILDDDLALLDGDGDLTDEQLDAIEAREEADRIKDEEKERK